MTRILLVLMAVLGINAADLPAHIGDALGTVGNAGGQITQGVSNIASDLNLGNVNLANLDVSNVTQASMLGGLGSSATKIYVRGNGLGSSAPINVGKVNMAASRSKGLSLSF